MTPTFETSKPYSGSPEELLRSFVPTLTQLGFRLEKQTPDSREFVGPGMSSSRQSPLLGASRILVRIEGRDVRVQAELGGVAKMKRFLVMLIGGLCVGLGALFGGLGAAGLMKSRNGGEFHFWIVLLPFVPWVFLIPWMARLIEKRTRAALDTLVHNLVQSQER